MIFREKTLGIVKRVIKRCKGKIWMYLGLRAQIRGER